MLVSTKAIVLSKIKYRDYDLIVKSYTQEQGVVNLLLHHVLKRKKNTTKAAYFQALSQIELLIDYKDTRDLQRLKSVQITHPYTTLHTHVPKSAIALFIAEILSQVLQEEVPNESLFKYLETTFLWLDTHTEYANFHLLFLIKLTQYLGFYPETTQHHEAPFFSLKSGRFVTQPKSLDTLSGEHLSHFKQLLNSSFDNLNNITINLQQRQFLLNSMLRYFAYHLDSFKNLKSLPILSQVFGN